MTRPATGAAQVPADVPPGCGGRALTVSGVRAGHPGVPVLHDVDLHVPAGALAAVLGSSGSGKTTLLRCVAGFHRPDAGRIALGDRTVDGPGVSVPPERRRVGLVPQEGALFGHLTVAGNVGFGLARGRRRAARVGEVLELVGLADLAGRRPAELSGGQQQRVALARALAPEPDVVLLDEPFTALDAGLRADVRGQVRAALRAAGATAVLVTHDREEALGSADLVAVLREGRVVQAGPPRQVYTEPADPAVAMVVGDGVLLPATARDGVAHTVLGPVPVRGDGSGRGRVLLRPEQVGPGAGDLARVTDVVFHGHDTSVLLDVGGTVLRYRTLDADVPAVGSRAGITVLGPARFFADP